MPNQSFQNNLDLTGVFGEYVIQNILDKIASFNSNNNSISKEDKKPIETLLKNHYIQIYNWCMNIEFFGLSKPQKTDLYTVELSMTTNIKRISGAKKYENLISEEYILNSNENILVLGDPGSGKTTCLKRITQKILFPSTMDFQFDRKFPILIRLKDLKIGDSIFKKISEMIGLSYRIVEEPIPNSYEIKYKYCVNDILLEDAICSFLNEAGIYLILDGFDEIRSEIKEEITKEIELISEKQSIQSKTIISCRSGEYYKTFRYFSLCEILPLTTDQIIYIISRWLEYPEVFFDELIKKQYSELANRPLFLGHLLILFTQRGELPNTSIDVYEKTVNLLIKNWDGDRDIFRKSKYSNFDNEEKQKFLEELSYILTYEIKTKVFDREIFQKAYSKIHKDYSLPKKDFELVANEIESHNGLIVKSFGDNYEFSHLVLQEYLCAKYLVTLPFNPKNLYKYIIEYPAPLAICVSISRESSSWFAYLILRAFQKTNFPEKQLAEKNLYSLLQRIIYERPKFKANCIEMGFALIYLIIFFGFKENETGRAKTLKQTIIFPEILEILKINTVEMNFIEALSMYRRDRVLKKEDNNKNGFVKIYLPINQIQTFDKSLEIPSYDCYLPLFLINKYVEKYEDKLKYFGASFK